jgi:mannose-6-phosphate isomerase-like protein (cupin superfamily)
MPDVRRVDEELARLPRDHHDFAEFFRAPSGSFSMSVVRWPAGSIDDQQPHTEDEVYYVTSGRAVLVVGDERTAVRPGSMAFVAAGVEHRFVEIGEDLDTLVFWSPARDRGGR